MLPKGMKICRANSHQGFSQTQATLKMTAQGLCRNCKIIRLKSLESCMGHIEKENGMEVHFLRAHNNYWNTFKCNTKSDPNIFLTSNHPNIQEISSLKTKVCVEAIRQKRISRSPNTSGDQVSYATKPPKITCLSNLEVLEFIIHNKISNEDELFATAYIRRKKAKKTVPTLFGPIQKNH